jgi:3-hydroxyisobutyrate dehydrogenase-like beta-hydroxyacid dehydrogenase
LVGLIGVGLMGSALAARLRARGFGVLGFDLRAERLRALQELEGQPARDAREVASQCRRVILSLPTSAVAREVIGQLSEQLRPGQIILDTTTGEPRAAAELGRQLEARGVAYLDATISGSSTQARRGEVTVLAGGAAEAFAQCQDIFECFARRAFHLGSWGSGARMKLVTNLVLGLNRTTLAEGLALAKALGFDLEQTLAVLRECPSYSRVMDTKGGKMVKGDFTPEARLSQHLKDVRLILEAGREAGVVLPLSRVHLELLERAEAAGLGELDNAAILQVLTGLATDETPMKHG